MEKPRTIGLAMAIAFVPLVGSAFVAFAGLLTWGLECDESCTGEGWQRTAGAPQWTVLAILAFAVFAAGIALFVFVARAKPWHALAALVVGALVLATALVMWQQNIVADFQDHPLPLGALAVVLLAGLFAALLCAPEKR